MSERTALEIADRLESLMPISGCDAARTLRAQHAEIERLTKQVGAYATMTKAQESQLSHFRAKADENQSAVATLDSERSANERLTAEIDLLKRERHHVYDLLARIHMDGGQYTAEHGVEKACDDAEAHVVTWLESLSSLDSLCEQAMLAERAACERSVDNERVKSVSESDDVYNTAIDHALAAIRERTKK